MVLGAVGSFISSVGGAALKAGAAMAEDAALIVEAHPTAALIAAGVAGYEIYKANNPDHLGNNVDTKA